MASIAALVIASCWPVALLAPGVPGPPHLRPLAPLARMVLVEGGRRSPTVARLVDLVEREPVVVYVDTDAYLPVRGEVAFVRRIGETTYLSLRLNPRQTRDEMMATLGHELQHVLEIAGSPSPVTCADDLRRLYGRIGRSADGGGFESAAAIAAERAAREELSHRRAGRVRP